MIPLKSAFGDDAGVLREPNFQLLVGASALGTLGTALLSPVLDSLIDPFGVDAVRIGLLMSAFMAPAMVAIPITGLLSDSHGRKPVLTVGLLVFGLAGSAVSLTESFEVALALRAIQGVGYAGTIPVAITCLGDLYQGERQATAQGLRIAGSGVSQTVFPILAGSLVVVVWRAPFLIYALAVPLAVLVYLQFDEPSRDRRRSDGGMNTRGRVRALFGLLARRRIAAMLLAHALMYAIWVGFMTYNSVVVAQLLDGDPVAAGMLAAAMAITFTLVATQVGKISRYFDLRITPLVLANALIGIGFTTILVAPSIPVAIVGAGILGGGIGTLSALYRALINVLAPPSMRGTLVSLSESFGWFAGSLTPVAVGVGISTLEPTMGAAGALQTTVLSLIGLCSLGGIVSLFAVHAAARLPHEG